MSADLVFLKEKVGHDPLLPSGELYQKAFEKIRAALCHIEENEQFVARSEDALTFCIQTYVKGDPSFCATTQTHSNGRVDLTITAVNYSDADFKYKGEAKIWRGPVYVNQGVEQIVRFYSTGRHHRAFLLVYFLGTQTTCFKGFLSGLATPFPPGTVLQDFCPTNRTAQSLHQHQSGADIALDHFVLWIPETHQSQESRRNN